MTTWTDGYGGDQQTARDARLNSSQPTYNYGAGTVLDAGSSAAKGLLFFDLSAIPGAAQCLSATLYLTNAASKTSARTLDFYAVLAANWPWSEGAKNGSLESDGGPTWNYRAQTAADAGAPWAGSAGCSTAGVDYDSDALGQMTYTANDPAGTQTGAGLDAAAVQSWFGAGNANYGILFFSADGYPAVYASDHATGSYHPRLVVEYAAAGGTYTRAFGGGLASAGAAARRAGKGLGGAAGLAGALNRLAARLLGGGLSGSSGLSSTGGAAVVYVDGYGGDAWTAKDALMSETWADRNGGGHPNAQFAANQRFLLQFDLSAIPSGAACVSARLYLYHSYAPEGGGVVTVNAYAIAAGNAGWEAGTKNIQVAGAGECCWNAFAADGAGGVATPWAGSAGLGAAGTDYETPALGSFAFDGGAASGTEFVCPLNPARVAGWFGAVNSNYGMVLWPASNSGHVATAENGNASYRPRLVVEYVESSLVGQTLGGALASAGSLVKATGAVLAGGVEAAGAALKDSRAALTGALGAAGALLSETLAATVSAALEGWLELAGGTRKAARRETAGALTPLGAVRRGLGKALAGGLRLWRGLGRVKAGQSAPAGKTLLIEGENRRAGYEREERVMRIANE